MYPNDTTTPGTWHERPRWCERPSMPPNRHKGWILALMVERKLSPGHSGLIAEIAARVRQRSGALTLLPREAQDPASIRSIQMRSTNRGRLESLPGRTLRCTQLLSRFSHVDTQTSNTLKGSLDAEDVLVINPLDAECRAAGNRDLVEVTSHNRAIRPHPQLSDRVSAGVVYSRFDHSRSHLSYVTSELPGARQATRGTR